MISIKIVCVGQLTQNYWQLAAKDYYQRLSKQANCEIKNIREGKFADININIKTETVLINEYIANNRDYQWILLDLHGKIITSEDLSQIIINNQNYLHGKIGFIIGGSNGVSEELKNNSKIIKIAFGKITLLHQLCYVVLLEQIYRSLQIMNHHPYHK